MKTKEKILATEFKKESCKFIINYCAVLRNDALLPVSEFNDLEFNYKFLMMVNPVQA